MLVYENYKKFISATDTIKRMESNILGIEANMEQLLAKVYSTSVAMLLTAVVSVFLFGFHLSLAFFLSSTFTLILFERYKFHSNGEYVKRWLPEFARLATEWIHHPWNAPEFVLQAAGIELLDAAKVRLQQQAVSEMQQHEVASKTRDCLSSGDSNGGKP
ncbi:Cryptochrome/DNA photolyase, FAD-binding domain containing protein [Parasponia andersonii]|uniref:Vacuolar protein sorting-associated protein 51 homolog n=1 Tax=Parasponia andersonii TaxID=3476 RepID=A0A2P5CF89_PARAD|nr:Cryptochrome/DNA photolyase, FAD-binding domain containing protein [Parasponia andersonii]